MGPVVFAFAVTNAGKVVLPATLVADGAIGWAVMTADSGRGALAMPSLVTIRAQFVGIPIFTLFDLIIFCTSVFALCGVNTVVLGQAACRSFAGLF